MNAGLPKIQGAHSKIQTLIATTHEPRTHQESLSLLPGLSLWRAGCPRAYG